MRINHAPRLQVPIYDFKTSSRVGYKEVEVPTSRVIILEGIYALNSKLRDMIDLRVSVTGTGGSCITQGPINQARPAEYCISQPSILLCRWCAL